MSLNKKVLPPTVFPGISISGANRRRSIDSLLLTGKSIHSRFHQTLAYNLDFCERIGIPYTLRAAPKEGYYLELGHHNITRVTVTSASTGVSQTGTKVLRVKVQTLTKEKFVIVLALEGPGTAISLARLSAMAPPGAVVPERLRRKTFYCRVTTEEYMGKPVYRAEPIKIYGEDVSNG